MHVGRRRDDFSKRVSDTLAKRAAYICSNPRCRKPTLIPSEQTEKLIYTGVAAHITAASPGGPRYDDTLTPAQRSSIKNGIFLCVACSTLIDKNGGPDYPVALLRKWKAEHEVWVRDHLHELVTRSTAQLRAPILDLSFDGGSTKLEIEKARVPQRERDDRIKGECSERMLRLDLQLSNKGDAPASEIDVFIDIKGPFVLYDEKQLRRLWEIYPHSLLDDAEAFVNLVFGRPKGTGIQEAVSMFVDGIDFSLFKDLIQPKSARPPRAARSGLRAHLSQDQTTIHLNKLKQNLMSPIQPIFVVFHSYEDVSSFNILFRLNAEEIPEDIQGKLEVVVKEKS